MSKKKSKLKFKIKVIGFTIAFVVILLMSCFAGLNGITNYITTSAENSAKGYTIAINGESDQEITEFLKNNGSKSVSRAILTAKVDNLLSKITVFLEQNAQTTVTLTVNGYYEDIETEDEEQPEVEAINVGTFVLTGNDSDIVLERKIVVAQGDTLMLEFSTATSVMLVGVEFEKIGEMNYA